MKCLSVTTYFLALFLLQSTMAFAITGPEAVSKALAYFPSIHSGEEKVKASRDLLESVWTQLLPSASVSDQIIHTSVHPAQLVIGGPRPVASSLVTYGFTAPLFDSGLTIFQAQAAKASTRAQESNVEVVKNSVALQAMQAYVAVVVARQELTVYQELRNKLDKLSQSTSSNDQLTALILASISEMDDSLISAQQSNRQAESAYLAIVGEAPDKTMDDLFALGTSLSIPHSPDDAYDSAVKLNPGLLVLSDDVDVTKAQKRAAYAKEFGPIAAYSFGMTTGDRKVNGTALSPDVKTGTLTAGINFSLGGPSRIAAARHQQRAAEYDLQTASIQLKDSMDTTYSQNEAYVKRLKSLNAAYATASAAYDQASQQIDTGQNIDVASTRQILTNMKTATDSILAVDSSRVLVRAQIRVMMGDMDQY